MNPCGPSMRSALSAVGLQWTMRALGLISLVVLARMLSPADFGIVGLAMTAVAAAEIFSYIGLRQILVRLPQLDRSYLDSAWTIQLALFSVLAVALALSAPLVSSFYGEAAVGPVIAALSMRFILLGLVNIGIVDFDRNLQFGRDLLMRLSGRIVSLVIAIGIAVAYQSYWALVAGILAQAACLVAASYVLHPFRPRLSLARRGELIGVSGWMFASLAAQVIQTQAGRVVLGRHAPAESVGAFAVSKDLSEIFTHEIATALNRVSFVDTSRAGALSTQGARISRLLGSYALVTAPLGLGVAAVAPELFTVFLGDQWSLAAKLTVVLAPAGAVYAISKLVVSSLQAAGRERTAARVSIGSLMLMAGALGTAIFAGKTGAAEIAWVTLLACLGTSIAGLAVIARQTGSSALAMLWHVARPFLAALLMFAIMREFAWMDLSPAFALGAKILTGVPLYVAGLLLVWAVSGRPAGAEAAAVAIALGALTKSDSAVRRT